MTDTMYALRTWRERNGKEPLAVVAKRNAQALRAFQDRTPRPASPVQTRVAAVKADPKFTGRPAGSTAPAHRSATQASSLTRAEKFKIVDALANTVPVGLYALRRAEASSAGNTVTFLKVYEMKARGDRPAQRRIVQLVGSVGAFAEHSLPIDHQYWALKHVAEGPMEASALFGQETSTCGVCGSPLTNDASRARGIGPKCATKF